jgi:hypothetical protein
VEERTPQRLIYSLKAIMAVPPVPPNYVTAHIWREQMLADLNIFTQKIVNDDSAVVSIEVFIMYYLCSACNLLPFCRSDDYIRVYV